MKGMPSCHHGIFQHLLVVAPADLPGHLIQVVEGIEDDLQRRPFRPEHGIDAQPILGEIPVRLLAQRDDRDQQADAQRHAEDGQQRGEPVLAQTFPDDLPKVIPPSAIRAKARFNSRKGICRAKVLHHALLVAHHHQRTAVLHARPLQQRDHFIGVARVERAGGLVGQDERRGVSPARGRWPRAAARRWITARDNDVCAA